MSKTLHIICGSCGSDQRELSYHVGTGEFQCVTIHCHNCCTNVDLDDIIDEEEAEGELI